MAKNSEEQKELSKDQAVSVNPERVAELEKLLAESREALTSSEREKQELKQGLEEEKKAREDLILENRKLDEHAAQMEESEQLRQKSEKRRKVIIAEDGPNGKRDVFIGIQGVAYQIKRGVEVEIPESVYSVLSSAGYTVYDEVGEGDDVEYVPRFVPRFNFRIVE
ncbi:hypothetical protein [Maridesulfovibrio bastinii]|uniref:hypothetical protein n=1 Tax=Maridesulfovibrio bastinii TaxID=47157 RepID=UPI00040AE3AB|nr:hypothetical protein [Maridesulfovibrio bastinii]